MFFRHPSLPMNKDTTTVLHEILENWNIQSCNTVVRTVLISLYFDKDKKSERKTGRDLCGGRGVSFIP